MWTESSFRSDCMNKFILKQRTALHDHETLSAIAVHYSARCSCNCQQDFFKSAIFLILRNFRQFAFSTTKSTDFSGISVLCCPELSFGGIETSTILYHFIDYLSSVLKAVFSPENKNRSYHLPLKDLHLTT